MIILYQDRESRVFFENLNFSALRFREPHSKSVNLKNFKKITKKACNRKRVFLYSFPRDKINLHGRSLG